MNDTHDKAPRSTNRRRIRPMRPMRAKLIFNPSVGAANGSSADIVDVIHEMQAWKLVPEAFMIEEGCDLPGAHGPARSTGRGGADAGAACVSRDEVGDGRRNRSFGATHNQMS